MILSILLPFAMPIVALVCLLGALSPSRVSRFLLISTACALFALTAWYVATFFLGVI
ncbi:hypothetical protein [Pseudooceanicola nitratireducens]|uniref:hypothetical protein n=1 Tax=Pseudooceanicola nitratireducens TaxID=517719 RepID=UPI003C7BA032